MINFRSIAVPVLLLALLSGCVNLGKESSKTDFDLKKECSIYIEKYEEKFSGEFSDPENQSIIYGDSSISNAFDGVYYSKRINSCVVKISISILDDDKITEHTLFIDALSGIPIEYSEIRDRFGSPPELTDPSELSDFLLLVQ
ncbi:MAG: hypothetical protein KKA19_05255 [Candidatus Margulisbacteria bacterium]|nr:hypothetical protein [Candidatus Margulisiibacteriota bacterium]